jgi:hypothetical protein
MSKPNKQIFQKCSATSLWEESEKKIALQNVYEREKTNALKMVTGFLEVSTYLMYV